MWRAVGQGHLVERAACPPADAPTPQAEAGAAVRVGGRLSASSSGQGRVLTTTDGGSLEVSEVDGSLPPEVAGGAFVEVVGTKAGDGALRTTGIVAMPGKEPMGGGRRPPRGVRGRSAEPRARATREVAEGRASWECLAFEQEDN